MIESWTRVRALQSIHKASTMPQYFSLNLRASEQAGTFGIQISFCAFSPFCAVVVIPASHEKICIDGMSFMPFVSQSIGITLRPCIFSRSVGTDLVFIKMAWNPEYW